MSPSEPRRARRGLVIQHHEYAPPARFADWAQSRGIALDVVLPPHGERFPDPRAYDLALVLGSDATAAGDPRGWVADELEWLRGADSAGLAMIGVCFGGQALARALGGQVERAPEAEVGWITATARAGSGIPEGPWFTWHEDFFTPPPDAVELARTERFSQVFALRSHIGVQFHPEVTDELVDVWSRMEKRRELRELRPELLERPKASAGGKQLAEALFDAFLRRAGLGD
jgi:GMP synthase-like glutamine amidotransferase